jgi:hypothetical protein
MYENILSPLLPHLEFSLNSNNNKKINNKIMASYSYLNLYFDTSSAFWNFISHLYFVNGLYMVFTHFTKMFIISYYFMLFRYVNIGQYSVMYIKYILSFEIFSLTLFLVSIWFLASHF